MSESIESLGGQNMNMDPNLTIIPMMNNNGLQQQNINQYPVVGNNKQITIDKFDGVTMNTVLRWKQYGKMNVECFLGFNEAASEMDKASGAEILSNMGHFYCILCECYIRANKKSVGRHQNSNRRHVKMIQEYAGNRAIMMPVGQPLKHSFDISNHNDYLPQHRELDHQHQQQNPYQHFNVHPADGVLHNHQYMNMQMMQSSSASSYAGVDMQSIGMHHSSAPKAGGKPIKRIKTPGSIEVSGMTHSNDIPSMTLGQEAWSLITHSAKVADVARLTELLTQLNISNGDDLLRRQQHEIMEIIQTLKVVPGRRLIQLFNAANSSIVHQSAVTSSSSSSSS